jgi:hypothetical protein
MSFEIKQFKIMLHTKTYLPKKNLQRKKSYTRKAQRKKQNYVPTPQGNPLHEKPLIHRIK